VKISVRVKPNSRKNEVKNLDDGTYLVSVKAPATEGRANAQLLELLADHFGRHKRDIAILRGAGGRHKIVEVR